MKCLVGFALQIFLVSIYAHAEIDDEIKAPLEAPLLVRQDFIDSPRLQILLKASTLTSTALLVPTMTFLGALIANPQWSIIGDIPGRKSKISYIDHTISIYTIPMATLFAFLGTFPLWGFLLAEHVL